MSAPGSLPPQLRQSAQASASPAAPPMDVAPSVQGSWLVFEIDAQVFALDSRQLRQILPAGSVVRLPGRGCAPWPGVSAWNGRLLGVLDGGAVLGRRPSLGLPGARLLVVHDEGRTWALLVDLVRGVHQEDPQRLIDVQATLQPPWNALCAMLTLPRQAGDEACPVLHLPTLYRGSLPAQAPSPGADPCSSESRS